MEQSKASVLRQKQFEVYEEETKVALPRTMIRDFDNMIEGHVQSVIETGELMVNLDTKTVEVNGRRVHLTSKEYQMLELLSLHKGTTLTKEMFLNHLYGGMDEPELKIFDVFICKLRKKLRAATGGQHYIETIWGRGYALRDPRDAHVAA
jgi:two-component system, cell cycle response regulator CtrA